MVIKQVRGVARTLTGGGQKWLKTHPGGEVRRGRGRGREGEGEGEEGGGRRGGGRKERTIQRKFTSNFRRGYEHMIVCL